MNRLQKVAQQVDNAPPQRYDTSYTAKEVHDDLEKGKVAGAYGGNHAAYLALSEVKQNIDLHATIRTNFENPLHNEDLDFLLQHPRVRSRWHEIVSFDPWGMYATRPTICGTKGCMRVDELRDVVRDGKIVNEDGSINIVKAAIDPVWNIKGLVKRLGLPEGEIREALYRYTKNPQVKDPEINSFLPNIGSTTLYFFGDLKKLADPATETAVRVHDECNGSDVFGTDICTCRPYLMFAIAGAVECAQRGGVGVVIYYRKEGRSLGEVTKFRVYNARKQQEGGDRPEMYFYATESIAGVRDARFQELMPDPLVWLGITRIDWLMSMSSDKYDAITSAGVQVMQRISLPEEMVPAGAGVEINAKIASGYHTDKIDPQEIQQSLWNLALVRQRCQQVYDLALKDKLPYMRLNLEKLPDAVALVVDTIKKNYPNLNIPQHSRWRHFQINGTDYLVQLAQKWRCDQIERARRLVDLTVISVLLDAGAGREWRYFDEQTGRQYQRSEGLAIATLAMFDDGAFSTDSSLPWRVNAHALRRLEAKTLLKGFQVNEHNPMVGLEGRAAMINRLGQALLEHPEFFGEENPRPGNLVDYLLAHSKDRKVSMLTIWDALSAGFESMWPARAGGVRRGDVWSHNSLKQMGRPGSDLVPFHKLLQWLAYSLVEPLSEVGLTVTEQNALTGLAEYRNGGLLIDTGVLQPKNQEAFKMMFDAGSEFVVEWRALTVVLLDKIAEGVRQSLGKTEEELPMSNILEGGTWRAGREIAARLRPTGESPINVRSDGTVF